LGVTKIIFLEFVYIWSQKFRGAKNIISLFIPGQNLRQRIAQFHLMSMFNGITTIVYQNVYNVFKCVKQISPESSVTQMLEHITSSTICLQDPRCGNVYVDVRF
jgi:hypothetical protein